MLQFTSNCVIIHLIVLCCGQANERKTLKQKLKEKRARQARQAGGAKPRKRRASDAPEPGVYRVVNSAKLQAGAEVRFTSIPIPFQFNLRSS